MMWPWDYLLLTHKPTGHVVRIDAPYRASWFKAKARAIGVLKGKLWTSPDGPGGFPSGEVSCADLSHLGRQVWFSSEGAQTIDAVMAAALEKRLRQRVVEAIAKEEER